VKKEKSVIIQQLAIERHSHLHLLCRGALAEMTGIDHN